MAASPASTISRTVATACQVAPYDDYGHGTHIAGLIGSKGVLSNDAFQGIAPVVRA